MAQPVPVVTFSSLPRAEDLRQGREPGEVAFVVERTTSLMNAVEIKDCTRAGVGGFEVLNPELLDCKSRTKTKLERAYEDMIESCMDEYNKQILILNAHIATLKQKINKLDAEIQHIGPPILERNRGIQQVLYLQPRFEAFPSYYEYEPQSVIPFQPPFATDFERDLATERDRHSQKAWWHINLTFLETQRRILEEKKLELERQLKTDMKNAIHSESDLGCGYADYTFLHK